MFRNLLLALFIAFSTLTGYAQTTSWGFNVGGTTADVSHVCKVAPNGNVYIAGKFTGTMDLDPGAATHNITSNGQDDIFVACYSPSGNYLWGFGAGGTGYDAALNMAVDASSNLVICGYIQSAGIDFDPGGSGAYIGYAGGTGLPYNGDGFIVKYSASGAFLWGLNLGGTTVNDASLAVATDATGNIYVSGIFAGVMPTSGSTSLSGFTGQAYLAKYNPSGSYIWAHNFGAYNTDCYPKTLQVAGSNIYMGGYFSGTADFNPWGSGANLTAVGNSDAFIAKYDTAGNYAFAKALSGNGSDDEVASLYLDTAGNIYVTGFTNSTALIFNAASAGTSTVTAAGGGGNYDMFLARYDNSGNYQWGKITGNTGNEHGYCNEIAKGYLYCTGAFQSTVDFDPSAAVANFTSAGGEDIFLTKYDLNGNYVCGFRTGAAGTDDIGYGLAQSDSGYMFNTGQFGGTGVDFNPSSFTLSLTSNGATDAYLVKHQWRNDTTFAGYLTGDTICLGDPAYLTLHITTGITGPYTLSIFNGTTTTAYTGVFSGVPFLITPRPTDTTNYTITAALPGGANLCTLPPATVFGSATVIVHFLTTHLSDALIGCNTLRLTASNGDTTYHWTFGDGSSSSVNPVVHTYTAPGVYTAQVIITDTNYHCTATDTTVFTVTTTPVVSLGRDTLLCANTYRLQSLFSYPSTSTYLWSNATTDSFTTVTTTNNYWLKVTDGLCSVSDTVRVTLKQQPIVNFGNDTSFCQGHAIILTAFIPAGSTYSWNTGTTGSSVVVNTSGAYTLTVNNSGCTAYDSINVTVKPNPLVHLGPDITQCAGAPVVLKSTDTNSLATYLWNTGAPVNLLLVTASGSYSLKVTLNGCSVSDTVNVTINPLPNIDLGNDAYLCVGSSLILSSAQPASAQYFWSTGNTSPTITVTEPGLYTLTVNLNGCVDSDQILVNEIKAPTIRLGQDTLICNGYILHLLVTADQATYLWSDGSLGKSFNISEPGTYWATVTNDCGMATDTINVRYKFCDIWFPNAFTPNGDGKNDVIRVRGSLNEFTEYVIRIFNRWGEMVFTTENITEGWDGNYKSTPQSNGTYFYQMYYKVDGRKEMLKGDFELVR